MHEKSTTNGEAFANEKLIEDFDQLLRIGREIDIKSKEGPTLQADLGRNLIALITNPEKERTDDDYISAPHLNAVLGHIGLPANQMLEAWTKVSSESLTNPAYTELRNNRAILNYLTVLTLELQEPNSAKILHDEFGIKTFARYSKKFLLNQFNSRDDRITPYGIAAFSRTDSNGAFYSVKPTLDSLSESLEDSHTLRAYEVESKSDLVNVLLQAEKRYGPNEVDGNRISFGILGGHGSGTGIHLDGENSLSTLDTYFRNQRWDRRLGSIFEDDATLMLFSCSTGMQGGIAQELSDTLNIKVIAPEKDCYTDDCTVEAGDSLAFEVKYVNAGEIVDSNVYHPGDQREFIRLDLGYEKESYNFNPQVFRVIEQGEALRSL